MHKKHFFLGNQIAENKGFTPQPQGGGSPAEFPQYDNRRAHADALKQQYANAFANAINEQEPLLQYGQHTADGAYLDFTVPQNMIPSSLDTQRGARIMKIHKKDSEDDNVDVTVFVSNKHKDWFDKKADKFATAETEKKKPCNESLIAPIQGISSAKIESLFESKDEYEALGPAEEMGFELWICKTDDYNINDIQIVLDDLRIKCQIEQRLQFADVDVFLITTNKTVLAQLPYHMANISEIRRYKQPSILTESSEVSREWTDILANELQFEESDVHIGILDSGVNNAHPLIAQALPDSRMSTAINVQDNLDHIDHGTGMAGLVLMGDLTKLAYDRGNLPVVQHNLASVKIVDANYSTAPSFYGAVIEDAISQSQDMGADIDCMAVTDSISDDGKPTSSSAALDESIYHSGECDCLVLVSAGNIYQDDVDATNYIKSCKANAINSPAQAWNALTVGAYTELSIPADKTAKGIASPKGVSPYSCTSFSWHEERVKPEIVMEGGNLAYSPSMGLYPDEDLCLITTSNDLRSPLETFNATSAATALAARLAAKIKVENPNLSMLSIRALMVHSARWTDEMKSIDDGRPQDIIPLCGYGVPDEDIAAYSSEKYATYVFENELKPYKSGGANTYNEMHFYALPWPVDVLEAMHDEVVTLRITLSYYVEPAPGKSGKNNKYRYPSATLRFDVKTPIENDSEFLARHNKLEGEKTSDNNSTRWNIGQQRRERGTVQSDWFSCTAQELASCGQIVVFPGPGWWKERKLENVDNKIKYSLVVSIQTEKTEIYQAVETAIANRIAIPISNHY